MSVILGSPGLLLHFEAIFMLSSLISCHCSEEGPFLITVIQQELMIRTAFCSKGQRLKLFHFDNHSRRYTMRAGIQIWFWGKGITYKHMFIDEVPTKILQKNLKRWNL